MRILAKVNRFLQGLLSDEVWQTIALIGVLACFFTGRWLELYGLAALSIMSILFTINRSLKNQKLGITVNIRDNRGE